MDFNDTPEESAFRAEARAWLEASAERKQPGEKQTRRRECPKQGIPDANRTYLEPRSFCQSRTFSEHRYTKLRFGNSCIHMLFPVVSSMCRNPSMKCDFLVSGEQHVIVPLLLLIAGHNRGRFINAIHGGKDGVDLVDLV